MDNFENQSRARAVEVPIRDSNIMQRDLMIRAREKSGVDGLAWIKEISERFRKLITDKPELCLGYSDKSEEEKLKMLETMEQELYSAE